MRGTARLVAAFALTAAAASPGTSAAQYNGIERIRRYDVVIDVEPSGRIHVVETIDYSFGVIAKRGIFRTVPVRFRYDDRHDRVYPLTNVRVTGSPGTPVDTAVTTEDGVTTIRIGNPDVTIDGDHTYVISYDVDGALNRFAGHDELFWNAVGHDWRQLVERASVTVRAAAPVSRAACYTARARGRTATFAHGLLRPFEGVTVVAALPPGYAAATGPVLVERHTLRRAFRAEGRPLALALAVLLAGVGGVAALVYRAGRDRHYPGLTPGLEPARGEALPEARLPLAGRGAVSVDFAPGDDMRPALMGVLVDERADPLDVTATIVDLAVRGHLTIEELPREGRFGRPEWALTRLDGPEEPLRLWEGKLLKSLFRSGDVVLLAALKEDFGPDLVSIRDLLYREVVSRGWFTRRPDETRGRWGRIAAWSVVLALGATAALARFTPYGLTGVALVVVAATLYALSPRLPFRTARGRAALDRAEAFRRYLVTAEADQLRAEERAGVFARYLPYAIVMGEAERWARAFGDLGAGAGAAPGLAWYAGPDGWSPAHLPGSISSFSASAAGTIASARVAVTGGSGFSGGDSSGSGGGSSDSGGGSSGGGGGGGGGGSW